MFGFDIGESAPSACTHVIVGSEIFPGLRAMRRASKAAAETASAADQGPRNDLPALIGIAQSRALFAVAQNTFGAERGCDIERALVNDYGEFNRPRWWDRLNRGDLRIGAALRRNDEQALYWMARLREHTDDGDRLLAQHYWALLDPAPRDVSDLLDLRADLRRQGVFPRGLSDGRLRHPKQLINEAFAIEVGGPEVALTNLLWCLHVARAIASPLDYLMALGGFLRLIRSHPLANANSHSMSDVWMLLDRSFSRLWLRPSADLTTAHHCVAYARRARCAACLWTVDQEEEDANSGLESLATQE